MIEFEVINYENYLFKNLKDLFLNFVHEKNNKKILNDEKIGENLFNYLNRINTRYVYLVREIKTGKIVGFLIGKEEKIENIYTQSYEKINISYFYVLKNFRGYKLSTLLKDKLILDAKKFGIKKISLKVSINNNLAKKIYNPKIPY